MSGTLMMVAFRSFFAAAMAPASDVNVPAGDEEGRDNSLDGMVHRAQRPGYHHAAVAIAESQIGLLG